MSDDAMWVLKLMNVANIEMKFNIDVLVIIFINSSPFFSDLYTACNLWINRMTKAIAMHIKSTREAAAANNPIESGYCEYIIPANIAKINDIMYINNAIHNVIFDRAKDVPSKI